MKFCTFWLVRYRACLIMPLFTANLIAGAVLSKAKNANESKYSENANSISVLYL